MTALHRIRIALSAFPGGPGVMTLFSFDAPALLPALDTWITAQFGRSPAGMVWQTENSGDIFESTTGEVSGVWTAAVQPVHTSGTNQAYAGGVGYLVHWKSDTYLSGRLLRGRSFCVPVVSGVFENDGTLVNATRAAIEAESNAFITAAAGGLAIWQRPRVAVPADGSRPAITARGGGSAAAVTATVPDRGVFLTSRRA